MIRKGARHLILLVVVTLLFSTSACIPNSPLTAKAPLTVLGTLQSLGLTEVVEARIIISRNKHIVEETVPVLNNSFSTTLTVPVGEWEVTVLLIDSQGIVLFQSKPEKIQITLTQSSVIDLVLLPADSTVHVRIDLEDYVFKHVAMRARIYFDNDYHEVTREDSFTPLEYTLKLAPASYEFMIELYADSFRVGDRISPGVWGVIHIMENEEFSISWSPVTEMLHVSGRVETLLPAPENVLLTSAGEGVRLTWDPIYHENVVGYFVFAQISPLKRFDLLNSVPLEEPGFLHMLENDHPPEIHYVIAAVSGGGIVGYYSAPQTWKP